jgi:uncharacterized membrane protein YhdT
MAVKGAVDYSWCSSLPHTAVYELFTTLSILPVFLVSDYLLHLFEKRERFLYWYDMGAMLLSIFFITAFWRRIPGSWNVSSRAIDMMGHWDDVMLLCGPLLAAAVLGYCLYIWALKSSKTRKS